MPTVAASAGKAAATSALKTHWPLVERATPLERASVGKSSEASMLGMGPRLMPKTKP